MSLYSFALRASFKISDTMRDHGLHDPAVIAHYDDLAYGPDPRRRPATRRNANSSSAL